MTSCIGQSDNSRFTRGAGPAQPSASLSSRRSVPHMRNRQAVHAFVEKRRRRRQSNKVLHGHPSPVHWLESDIAMNEVLDASARANQEIPKQINLYVGTPYCLPTEPDRCGFCLFPSEIYTGRRQLDEYLEHLEREGDMFRDHFAGARLASIYFGGGTSNLYKADQYPRLMDIVRGVFDIPATDRSDPRGHPPDLQPRQAAGDEAKRHDPDQHGRSGARRRADQGQRPQAARRPGVSDARVVSRRSGCRPVST